MGPTEGRRSIDVRSLVKTLKPPPKSRFLPGEVHPSHDKGDLKVYREHRVYVTYAKPEVDDKPPKFNLEVYYKPKVLLEHKRRVQEIDKENFEILQKLNAISRLGGRTDCWNSYVPLTKTRFASIDFENKQNMKMNRQLLKLFNTVVSPYATAKFLKDWTKNEEIIEQKAKYPLHWKDPRFSNWSKLSIIKEEFLNLANPNLRIRGFFDIIVKETSEDLGRLVFELYYDFVPKTCENFKSFCRGFNGMTYKNTPFHRITRDCWCQGGDVTKFNGTGGTSIYGDTFPDENFMLKHNGVGVLSTCNSGELDNNNSKFNLTFASLESMDEKRVVFGKIIRGLGNISKIAEFGSRTGKPLKTVIISNCGIFEKSENQRRNNKNRLS